MTSRRTPFAIRTRDAHPGFYLTLVSIIQSMAFAYLLQTIGKELLLNGSLSLDSALQGLTALFSIILVWHEYAMGTMLYKWTLDIWDSLIPFLMGISQYAMIAAMEIPRAGHHFSARRIPYWFGALTLFAVFGQIAYINQSRKAAADNRRNRFIQLTKRSGKQILAYVSAFLIATVALAIWPTPTWVQLVMMLMVCILFLAEMVRLNIAYRRLQLA